MSHYPTQNNFRAGLFLFVLQEVIVAQKARVVQTQTSELHLQYVSKTWLQYNVLQLPFIVFQYIVQFHITQH